MTLGALGVLGAGQPDALGQREGVDQEQLGEGLYLLGVRLLEEHVFLVRRVVAVVTDLVRPLAHGRREQVAVGESVDAVAESRAPEVESMGRQRGRGPLEHLAEHHPRGGEIPTPQAVCRLLVIARDLLGEVFGYGERLWFRMHAQHLEALRAQFAVVITWLLSLVLAAHLGNDSLSALTAHEQGVPGGFGTMARPVLTAEREARVFGCAVWTV